MARTVLVLFNATVIIAVILAVAILENGLSAVFPTITSVFQHHNTKHLQDEPPFRRLQVKPSGDILTSLPQAPTVGHHFNHSISHKRAWMHLQEVDGLKNEEVVMVVTSTVAKNGYFLRERVIASARTWLRLFANAIVVIEDSFEVRFAMRNCEMVDYPQYTTFSCHNEPTYLLSRKCSDEYYGAAGPCCKVDDAINFIVNVRPNFFQQIKFMLHCDDDMYWRPDQVFRWLASVQSSGINDFPLVANLEGGNSAGHGVWMVDNCKEIMTSGWYQPAMLNHALLAKMGAGSAAYGLQDTCKAFDVTHDVGLGVYAWLFGANHIRMPATNGNPSHKGLKIFRPGDMAMHCVKHHEEDRCDGEADNGWSEADRHNQNVVVGCGDIDHPIQGHDKKRRADMYDAWDYYKINGMDIVLNQPLVNEYENTFVVVDSVTQKILHVLQADSQVQTKADGTFSAARIVLLDNSTYTLRAGETLARRVLPHMVPLLGYDGTKHSKENDITKEWKAFTMRDCSPQGIKMAQQ